MKKIISCILILTLALSLLAACSGGDEDRTWTGAPVDNAGRTATEDKTDSTYNTVSEKVPEETGPSEDEIRRAVAEVIDSTPQYAEWSAVSIGRMITRVFDDYTLEVKPVEGSVYNATISGTYVPIADMPNYLLQGAITYRVDIEARTCVIVNDPDNINGILTSYVFN